MKHKKLKDFKEELNKLSNTEIKELLEDTRLNIGDMEAQLAERNAYDEVDEEISEEDSEWRARCLTALKWERRRFALLKRAVAKLQNVDSNVRQLRCAAKLLRKFMGGEEPTNEDRKSILNIFDYLRSIDAPKEISVEVSADEPKKTELLSIPL